MKYLTLILFLSIQTVNAREKEISQKSLTCKTVIGQNLIKIKGNQIQYNQVNVNSGRNLAGLENATTTFHHKFYFEGRYIQVFISNKNSPSDLRDTFSIQDHRGYKVTYPLTCK